MPLYKHDGKLLVVDGKLAAHEDCCCFTCSEFLDCIGTTMDATVTLAGYADGTCDCGPINAPFVISDMARHVGLGTCYYSGNIFLPDYFCDGNRFLLVSVAIGKPDSQWGIDVLVESTAMSVSYELTGAAAFAAIRGACPGGGSGINVPRILGGGGICDNSGSTATVSFGPG